jgi:hypothetical protein
MCGHQKNVPRELLVTSILGDTLAFLVQRNQTAHTAASVSKRAVRTDPNAQSQNSLKLASPSLKLTPGPNSMVMPAAMLAREIAEGIQRENRQRVAITPISNQSISQIPTQAATLLQQVCDDWGTTSLILNEYMELLKKWTESIQSLADPTDESIFDSLGTAYHTWMVQTPRSKVQDSSFSSKLQGPSSKLQATKSTGKDMIFNCGSMENIHIHTPRTTPVLARLLMGGYLKLHDPSSKRQAPAPSTKLQEPSSKLQAPNFKLHALQFTL